ncbi:hypothetical protein ACG83_34865 [Frankia sp. R43]|nr:hypothetical protein ACG83_34865 [Frankia sp. R43]
MLAALATIAHGYAHSREQSAGTIHPDARIAYYGDSGPHNRLHGGTVGALIRRGLVEHTDSRTIGAWDVTTLALTDAGWSALAAEHGAYVRPEWDRPDFYTAPLTDDELTLLDLAAETSLVHLVESDRETARRLEARGLLAWAMGRRTVTAAGRRALDRPPTADGLWRPWEGLTDRQADGMACVVCGVDYMAVTVPSVPVGTGPGGQVFACRDCAPPTVPPERPARVAAKLPDLDPHPVIVRGGDGGRLVEWPDDVAADLTRWAASHIDDGLMPFSDEPIPVVVLPRSRCGRDS